MTVLKRIEEKPMSMIPHNSVLTKNPAAHLREDPIGRELFCVLKSRGLFSCSVKSVYAT